MILNLSLLILFPIHQHTEHFLYPMNESVDNQQGRTCGEYCRAEDIINHIIRGE